MKLLKLAPVLLLALVFVLAGCKANTPTAAGVPNEAAPAADTPHQNTVTVTDTPTVDEAVAEVTYISAAEAESAALSDAGAAADSALGLHSEFDRDDRAANYDVDFCFDGIDYDYKINAVTGEVIKAEKELCDHKHSQQTESKKEEKPENTSSKITKDEAKAIALKHAGLSESSIKHLEIEYDKDDGVYKYEVSFDHNGYEYDYDINALTGEIISHEKEWDD